MTAPARGRALGPGPAHGGGRLTTAALALPDAVVTELAAACMGDLRHAIAQVCPCPSPSDDRYLNPYHIHPPREFLCIYTHALTNLLA